MKINFSTLGEGLAEAFGDCDALLNVERNRRFSYKEYHEVTNRIANALNGELGLQRGERFICLLQNDNLGLLHWLAAGKSTASCCHGNYRDSIDTHLRQIRIVGCKVAFVERDLLPTHYQALHEMGLTIVSMDPPGDDFPDALDFWTIVHAASPENPDNVHDDREHEVLVRFTGGTTGDSKCASYCADNLMMCTNSWLEAPGGDIGVGCRTLHVAPISHGSGMMCFPTLFRGGCTITMNEPNLVKWCDVVAQEKVTHAFLVPTLTYRLLAMPEAEPERLESLVTVFYGAAPMSPAKTEALLAKYGPKFVQVYGSTEHFALTLVLSKNDHIVGPGEEGRLASAGKRVPGVEVRIMDDDGNPVARGEMGEMYLRSRATISGYVGNPEGTAKEFVDGFWKSGDVGFTDKDGYIHIIDRKKDMIITGGFNVYATEVEDALNAHPAVFMSAVVGIPHEDWGEAVHAEVVLADGAEVSVNDLKDHVRKAIGPVKAPKSIAFADELPLSAVGKVLRKEVRAKYWSNSRRKVG